MEILDGLSSVTFTSKADLTTATAADPNCQQQKPTQTPHYSTILQEISQLTGSTLIAEPLPSLQRQHFGFTGRET